MKICAVVPVKALRWSKQRLAPVLGDRRSGFAKALLNQTLLALGGARHVTAILVVTEDREVADEARRANAEVLEVGADLNAACTLGLLEARARGAEICAIFHADLASLTAPAVDALLRKYLELRRTRGPLIGLVPCHEGSGTNVVVVDQSLDFEPAFGPRSFAAHMSAGGSHSVELNSPEAAFDIDTVADLDRLARGVVPTLLRPFVSRRNQGMSQSLLDPSSLVRLGVEQLVPHAARLRDLGHGSLVTYSRKVFLPLTHLCRDSCHYCTFARSPREAGRPYMSVDEAVEIADAGKKLGCKEALFTLGDRPEARYRIAADWLRQAGFASTVHYLAHVAAAVRDRTGLLPHINAGCLMAEEVALLRPVSASMGLMLENVSERLCERGGPHYGSVDKQPARRLEAIAEAGRQRVPFTSGLLIGIGETRAERIDSLQALAALHERYGHIQEIIIQNFLPKPGTRMSQFKAAPLEELMWTIAAARILFGPNMNIQAPPNLNPGSLRPLVDAGINDWGGVSPLTPDYVNPEAPWPHIERLRAYTAAAGNVLVERLTIYPQYAREPQIWLDRAMHRSVLELSDGSGRAREDGWRAGRSCELPVIADEVVTAQRGSSAVVRATPGRGVCELLGRILTDEMDGVDVGDVASLFDARGADFKRICAAANDLRARAVGDVATYVVNRNINYTNICTYGCGFCAFSKGKRKKSGTDQPYLLDLEQIGIRVAEAAARGATEVCLQGGIHPSFTGTTYIEILRAVKQAVPTMHVHAFSPLEVWHGASTLNLDLRDYLCLLKQEGLGSLPGTAAEILDDTVRQVLCRDKLNSQQWLNVIKTAHEVGLQTTATIMFGHVDGYRAWASHLLSIRNLQMKTGGFTEFVPLPFVANEAPLYKLGRARPGPTFREAVLMHAVARLVLHPHIAHIQTSWVKMGLNGMRIALSAGADDLGGTLMNESITRAAGAIHGQEMTVGDMRELADSLRRKLIRRTTLYGVPRLQNDAQTWNGRSGAPAGSLL